MPDVNPARAWKRNLTIDPFVIPISLAGAPKPLPIGSVLLQNKGVTTYTMQNPNLFWVWYRGWTGNASDMPTPMMKGHLIAPGGEHLRASQTPDWIVAVPWSRPGWSLLKADGSPMQTDAESVLIYTLGSGGL